MTERRFHAGDWIRVDGVVEGIVENVEFRSVLIRRFDQAPVHVPIADLANAPLINFSRMPHRRIYWKIQVIHSTTTEQLAQIRDAIHEHILESDDFLSPSEAACFVRIEALSNSSIDFLVLCFTRSREYADYLLVQEKLVLRIKEIVEAAGTSFAYPSRSIYLRADETAGPDRFVPESGGHEATGAEPTAG